MSETFKFEGPVLVTGANGFIGLRLVNRLVADGNQVRAFVLPGEALDSAMPKNVEICRGDITDLDSVERAMEGAGLVLHLASLVGDGFSEAAHERVTVAGAANVLASAAVRKIRAVLVSSIVVYGDAIARERCAESHRHGVPAGAYSRAKQAQEKLAEALRYTQGLQLSIVRPGNVYGPGPTPWVRDVLAKLKKGLPILISGGDFNAGLVHVDNVVDVIVRAAASPQAIGEIYNALDGSAVTWRRYFDDVAEIAGLGPVKSIPRVMARLLAGLGEFFWWTVLRRKSAPALTREALALVGAAHDIPVDKARKELGYKPRVSYRRGMAEVARYIGRPLPQRGAPEGMKNFIVTGAASGIGRHLVEKLLERGERVCAVDVQADALRELAEAADAGEQLRTDVLDVRKAKAWSRLIRNLDRQWDRVDVLMNVAGVLKPGYSWEVNSQDIDFHLDINTKGLILGTRAAAIQMKKQGHGHIINIASLAGVTPVPGLSLYCASKFAVRGFSLSAAVELREYGVKVTVVCPDAVATPMLDLQQDFEQAAMTFSGHRALTVADISDAILGRVLKRAPLEVLLPRTRGLLAKISSWNPNILRRLHKSLVRKGLARQRQHEASQAGR